MNTTLLQLSFYVPESHCEAVKAAIFAAGAGRVGHYEACCWQTLGQGQFRPLAGSQPFIGNMEETTQLNEYKVETVCPAYLLPQVMAALLKAHPYETVAYHVSEPVSWQSAGGD